MKERPRASISRTQVLGRLPEAGPECSGPGAGRGRLPDSEYPAWQSQGGQARAPALRTPAPPACPWWLRQQRPLMAGGGTAAQGGPAGVSGLSPPRRVEGAQTWGTPTGPGRGSSGSSPLPRRCRALRAREGLAVACGAQGEASENRCLGAPSGAGRGRWRLAQNLAEKDVVMLEDSLHRHPSPRNELDFTREQEGLGVRPQEGLPHCTGKFWGGKKRTPSASRRDPAAELGWARGHLPQRRKAFLPSTRFGENSRTKHGSQLARKGSGW